MMLNPKKCVFKVKLGKFLDYIVFVEVLKRTPTRSNLFQTRHLIGQRLISRLAALNRFLSKSTLHGLPLFKILKKIGKFEWNHQCQEVFDQLKGYLKSLPTLTFPTMKETLFLYADEAISATLINVDSGVQYHVYYVS